MFFLTLLSLGLLSTNSNALADDLIVSNTAMDSPAKSESGEPRLHEGADGILYLSWIESEEKLAKLCFSRFDERSSTWSPSKTIASGSDWFVNWADTPALCVLPDGTLAAHWLRRTGKETFAYEICYSLSTTGGAEWSAPERLHDDDQLAEHGFVSWVSLGDRFGVLWLGGPPIGESGARFSLLFREITREGERLPEVRLDTDTCTCCPTSLLRTESGELWAVYRDRSEAEVRDIYFVRRTPEGWTSPRAVFDDGWVMPGCPVNGPVLAGSGARVAVAWYTGAGTDGGRVNLAFNEGTGFGFPRRVDAGSPEGRPHLDLLENGDAVVVWLEVESTAAEWRLIRVSATKESGNSDLASQSATIVQVPHSRSSGFAQLAARKNGLVFAWTDPGSSPRVRTALLQLRP